MPVWDPQVIGCYREVACFYNVAIMERFQILVVPSPSPPHRSNYYRSIKLFFIGNGERGKTTLLRRLRSMKEDKHVERTAGIDIETWTSPDSSGRSIFKDHRKPVTFLAWDFAGQVL